jgi:hypothetical protein
MIRTRLAGAGLVAALALGAAACGSDAAAPPASTTTTTTAPPAGAVPPLDALDLEPMYGAALADIGLQLTDRGGLIDISGGGYKQSESGHHLALYVEPTGDRTVEEYIDGIRDVAVVFSDVFERWPGLESFDVCQEPVEDDGDPTTEPLPVTQIVITREQAAKIDWDTVSVAELVRSSREDPPGIQVTVSSDMINDPAFKAVVEEAS